jgi:predicted acylesterase/phospholipase RssA
MDMPTNSSLGLRKGRGEESELPSPITRTGSSTDLKRVNLALQGGGAHGAFTWGVLDRLL